MFLQQLKSFNHVGSLTRRVHTESVSSGVLFQHADVENKDLALAYIYQNVPSKEVAGLLVALTELFQIEYPALYDESYCTHVLKQANVALQSYEYNELNLRMSCCSKDDTLSFISLHRDQDTEYALFYVEYIVCDGSTAEELSELLRHIAEEGVSKPLEKPTIN